MNILTFSQFEQRVRIIGPPPFSINETAWAADVSILPTLVFLLALARLK
jgi:transcription initiation factor IIF auxiliary subunit